MKITTKPKIAKKDDEQNPTTIRFFLTTNCENMNALTQRRAPRPTDSLLPRVIENVRIFINKEET